MSRYRTGIANLCRGCDRDFAGVGAFDRHRTGVHDYTFAEGLQMDEPREDGRRCLDEDEMLAAGMELDKRGRWRIALSPADLERIARMRTGTSVRTTTMPLYA